MASFTYECTDLTCDFDGSGSSDSDGSVASYSWDLGDDNTGSGETVSHTYDADGTYSVTLTVTDDDGATDSTTESVSVSDSSSDDGGDDGDDVGNNDPAVDNFSVSTRSTGPWLRASTTWSVSDVDGDLDTVAVEMLDGSNVVDSASSSVSGSSASGETDLRTRGSADSVRITVTDSNGNTTSQSQAI
ncbi:MAG: PKD domain-containing protein [Actinobacteria bacterium]|nr:PKD domain-containing protein [Actinomycetota bacterium]